jgi:hypothetical protein
MRLSFIETYSSCLSFTESIQVIIHRHISPKLSFTETYHPVYHSQSHITHLITRIRLTIYNIIYFR